ncbi:MAG TPA: LON peptidase substrate-binding domain-containing protein [Vicinamibacterales bacterium]|nr:LON peptidase substrate-binding domain-containing protein [Vicinamibacterales bacterium]
MLPSTIPIFPLPNVVLFPNVFLPLHIFEERYRQMVTDALGGERMIGMVLLQPGYEEGHEGAPPIYRVGCAGLITHVERLNDGCFNIVLRGLERFRIVGEEEPSASVLYRRAYIAPIAEASAPEGPELLKSERQKLEALLAPLFTGTLAARGLPQQMPDDELINALAQYLELEPIEKQALLERDGVLSRCRSLVELLEMKALMDKGVGGARHLH